MSMPRPDDPARYGDPLPARPTVVVDRDSGAGVEDAVTEMVTYGDWTVDAARRAVWREVRDARAGDVLTVLGVRLAVR